LAAFFASAYRQMLRHEPSHQEFINAGKREASSGQPVGKMFNAVQVRPNSGCAILLTLQIADIRIGALAQNTRSEPVTVWRDSRIVLPWTAVRPSKNILYYVQQPEAGALLKMRSAQEPNGLAVGAVHIIRH
jgi:hypothetical protein